MIISKLNLEATTLEFDMPNLVLTSDDLVRLKPESVADILALLSAGQAVPPSGSPSSPLSVGLAGFNMDDVVDLTVQQIAAFVDGIHAQTVAGLRVFAEHGPVIDAFLLKNAGIANYAHFQGRVTKRTRTITGQRHAYLIGWDIWKWTDEAHVADPSDPWRGFISGSYAVTPTTYRSLRQHFGP
jgi:hypothetical protein